MYALYYVSLTLMVGPEQRLVGQHIKLMPLPRVGDHVEIEGIVYEVTQVMLTPDSHTQDSGTVAYVDCWNS